MRLSTEGGCDRDNPSDIDLKHALTKFGQPGNGFAILSASEETYIQAQGNRTDGYVIEYRYGDFTKHFSSKRPDISHEVVVEIFRSYRSGGNWIKLIEWIPGLPSEIHAAKGKPKALTREDHRLALGLVLFFTIGIILAAVGIYLAIDTQRFLARAVNVPGTVVKMNTYGGFSPVVDFVDLYGKRHTLYSSVSSTPPAFQVGEKVVVAYDPLDVPITKSAKIRSFGELWIGALIVGSLGVAFVFLPLAAFISFRRRGRR